MELAKLIYDGATYHLSDTAVADLASRGVIVRDEGSGDYELAPEHLIEEVESYTNLIDRPDAPKPPHFDPPKPPWWSRPPR